MNNSMKNKNQLNVAKRIVVVSYAGLFDDELEEITQAIQEKLNELELPKRVMKTIRVEIEEDPFYEDS